KKAGAKPGRQPLRPVPAAKREATVPARQAGGIDPGPAAILLGAAIVRIVLILGFRQAVSFDEPHYLRLAGSFLDRGFAGLLHPYWPPFFPLVIAFFKPLTGNLETAGRLVNLVSACVTVWLVFRMSGALFGRKESLIAAGFAAFYPPVAFASTNVMPESLFSALGLGGIWIAWKALAEVRRIGRGGVPAPGRARRGRKTGGTEPGLQSGVRRRLKTASLAALAGLLWGAAYLVRPEGIGFLLVFLAAAVLIFLFRRTDRKRAVAAAACASLGFLVLAVPYWAYLHAETGAWTLSTKGSVNQQFESAVYFQDESNPDPFYHLTPDNRHLPVDMAYHSGTLRELAAVEGGRGRVAEIPLSRTAVKFAKNYYRVLKQFIPQLFSALLLALFAAGLVGGLSAPGRWRLAVYLLAFPAFFWLAVIPMFHVNERYFLPLFPLMLPWIGRGTVFLAERTALFLSESFPRRFSPKHGRSAGSRAAGRAAALTTAAVIVVFGLLPETARLAGIRSDSAGAWADPVELKEAGRWLFRENGRPPVLMSLNKAVDFYAGQYDMRKGASFSYDDVSRNLAYARNRGVEYVVFSSRTLFWFPNLAPLLEEGAPPEGLRLVYASDRPRGVRTKVYRVEPVEAEATAEEGR
ncbi:glycosyltransferase family 39 protein, partial [bacterium]|nr:glycosyltransferase family 39 protein [bacterium]